MDYHSQLIEAFCKNLLEFGFPPLKYRKNVKWEKGEIDIVLLGELENALLEVKSNSNKMGKFTGKQFDLYREYDSSADIYLLMGNKNYSL